MGASAHRRPAQALLLPPSAVQGSSPPSGLSTGVGPGRGPHPQSRAAPQRAQGSARLAAPLCRPTGLCPPTALAGSPWLQGHTVPGCQAWVRIPPSMAQPPDPPEDSRSGGSRGSEQRHPGLTSRPSHCPGQQWGEREPSAPRGRPGPAAALTLSRDRLAGSWETHERSFRHRQPRRRWLSPRGRPAEGRCRLVRPPAAWPCGPGPGQVSSQLPEPPTPAQGIGAPPRGHTGQGWGRFAGAEAPTAGVPGLSALRPPAVNGGRGSLRTSRGVWGPSSPALGGAAAAASARVPGYPGGQAPGAPPRAASLCPRRGGPRVQPGLGLPRVCGTPSDGNHWGGSSHHPGPPRSRGVVPWSLRHSEEPTFLPGAPTPTVQQDAPLTLGDGSSGHRAGHQGRHSTRGSQSRQALCSQATPAAPGTATERPPRGLRRRSTGGLAAPGEGPDLGTGRTEREPGQKQGRGLGATKREGRPGHRKGEESAKPREPGRGTGGQGVGRGQEWAGPSTWACPLGRGRGGAQHLGVSFFGGRAVGGQGPLQEQELTEMETGPRRRLRLVATSPVLWSHAGHNGGDECPETPEQERGGQRAAVPR